MSPDTSQTIAELPPLLQPPATRWFERAQETGVNIAPEWLQPIARLVACSEFGARVLLRDLEWFVDNATLLSKLPDDDELNRFVARMRTGEPVVADAGAAMRRFRNRYLFRILWQEINGQVSVEETLRLLSVLADGILDAATSVAETALLEKFGRARDESGARIPLVILGMGKLGGWELNFSSDIDIIFCYPTAGETDGARRLSAQDYFARLARQIIALVDEVTADGFVFRVDTRLRPFGDSGPPVTSFAALESYLLQHGRDWERYAYIKARVVGPRPAEAVVTELHEDLIRPFVFRRYLDYGVFESLREMQAMIAAEVRRRELADNVKLGPGGIREAEFIVQALQLVRGGGSPRLRRRRLLAVLPLLVDARGLTPEDADALGLAYTFLRRVENFIQAIRDEQTHELPKTDIDRERLSYAMNYDSWSALLADIERHRDAITAVFSKVAIRAPGEGQDEQRGFAGLFSANATVDEWEAVLADRTRADARAVAERIVSFQASGTVQKIDSESQSRLQRFVPALLERVCASINPVTALNRTLAVTEKVLRRSAYLSLLIENPHALSYFVDLCARSDYIAQQIAMYPVLLDELLDPGISSGGVTKTELATELSGRLTADQDSESRMIGIAQFQRAVMFRVAVADFNETLPIMKVSDSLTWLAEAILEESLRAAWSDLVKKHGVPQYRLDGQLRSAGFGIVGYGKLGGLELSYGSDLDVGVLHASRGEAQITNGEKPLDNTVFFSRLVRRLVHFLTTQTGSGQLYEIDTRLRPDGRSGLLVTSTDAFLRYQQKNAWTWEHQALLRARAVAGSADIGAEFADIRRSVLVTTVDRETLRNDVVSMRRKMRSGLDASNQRQFDLKHGSGGIGDIEFLVQFLVLRSAASHPEVIEFSDNIRQLDALIAAEIVDEPEGERLQDVYRLYRLTAHHLSLEGEKALVDAGRFSVERDQVEVLWRRYLA